MDTIGNRLRWARSRAGFEKATEAARSSEWVISTYLGHENGDRNPSRETAKKYARAFKVRWEWLLEGEGDPRPLPTRRGQTPIVGYVGAGAKIHTVDDHEMGAGLDETDTPPDAPEGIVAVTVRGDSMYPRYFEGELIFYGPEQFSAADMLGRECIVRLETGETLVKIVRPGRKKGLFQLESWNASPLLDQEVKWASPVKWRG